MFILDLNLQRNKFRLLGLRKLQKHENVQIQLALTKPARFPIGPRQVSIRMFCLISCWGVSKTPTRGRGRGWGRSRGRGRGRGQGRGAFFQFIYLIIYFWGGDLFPNRFLFVEKVSVGHTTENPFK